MGGDSEGMGGEASRVSATLRVLTPLLVLLQVIRFLGPRRTYERPRAITPVCDRVGHGWWLPCTPRAFPWSLCTFSSLGAHILGLPWGEILQLLTLPGGGSKGHWPHPGALIKPTAWDTGNKDGQRSLWG